MQRKNIAVILAGGSGSRVGGNIPKQFLTLPDGRTVFETCVDAFEKHPQMDAVFIVMHPQHIDYARQLCTPHNWKKIVQFIAGGKERYESSWHALTAIREYYTDDPDCNVLLHDCARPFISQSIITRVCTALQTHPAVSVTVPVTDTIYCVDTCEQGQMLRSIPERNALRAAQTPQAFRLSIIYDAYQKAMQDASTIRVTDDCSILLAYRPDCPILLVDGETENRKLTYAQDFTPMTF